MKRLLIPGVFLLLLGLTWVTGARLTAVNEQRHAVGSGGIVEGDGYTLSNITAQPVAGRQSGADYNLIWGFWRPAQGDVIYLPVIFALNSTGFAGSLEREPNDSALVLSVADHR